MTNHRSGAPRRATGRYAAAVAAAVLFTAIAALVPASGAQAAPGLRLTRTLPGRAVEVRAGHTNVQAPAVLGTPSTRGPRTATIQVTYNGFSAAAQAAFQAAVDVWESQITSPRIIHVNANWTPLGTGVLGSAGPNAFYMLSDNNIYPAALAEALCNCEGNVATEITANFNSAFSSWYLGTDGNAPSSSYDFMTVVLHELGHGLGFLGTYYVSGTQGGWGFQGTTSTLRYDLGVWSAATGGSKLTNTALYPNPSAALKTQLTDGSVYFEGPNVLAANGGSRARIYAPNPWQGGSSGSHFDESTFPQGSANGNALMTPFLNNGEVIHVAGDMTLALFRDIGWTTSSGSTPSVAIANLAKPEGAAGVNTVFKFRVTLSAASASPVTVNFATANGTAVAPGDYTAKTASVTIPAGVTTGVVKVTVKGDSVVEPNETFVVNLTGATGATIADNQATGTIRNDD